MPPSTGSFNLKEKEVQLLRAVLTQVGDQVNAKNLSGELNITPNAASMRWLRFKDRFLGDINAAVAQGKDGVREGSMTANNPNSPANSPKTPALISDLGGNSPFHFTATQSLSHIAQQIANFGIYLDAGKHRKRARDELGGYEADSLSSPEAMKNVCTNPLPIFDEVS
jgi:hypothetical protein